MTVTHKIRSYMLVMASGCLLSSCADPSAETDYQALTADPLVTCNELLTDVLVGDLFNPPVASRIYAYPNIAAYEALVPAYPGYRSYTGLLNDMPSMPAPEAGKRYDFSISAVFAFLDVANSLVYSRQVINAYRAELTDSLLRTRDKSTVNHSIAFGLHVADSIKAWADRDQYRETRSMMRYELRDFAGAWIPTPPDYTPALEPHWGTIRPFAMDSVSQFMPPPPMSYDMEDTASQFYREMKEVYDISLALDTPKMNTAIFWDCNPNTSHHYGHLAAYTQKMTPGGHWVTIACNILKHDRANLMTSAETISIVASGIADAFIASWHVKYTWHTIRPVTVIQKHVDHEWQAYLQTPPFPEYTSAHSTVSASAAAILAGIYGEAYHWVDSSEVKYGIPVIKEFDSFLEAADEVSESRILGGIHYRSGVLEGRAQGLEIGKYIIEKLKARDSREKEQGS